MSSKQQPTKGAATDKNVVETADPTVDDDNKSDSEYEYEYEEIEVEVDEDYEEEYIDERGNKVMISEVETIVPKEEKKAQETLVLKSDGTTQKLVHKSKVTRATAHQEKQTKQERVEKPTKGATRVEKVEQSTKAEKVQQSTKFEKVQQSTKVEKVEKSKVEKMEKPKEPENQEVTDKPRLGRALTNQEESILLPLLQGLLVANGSDTLSKIKHENTPLREKEKEPPTSNKNSRSNSLAEKSDKSDSADGSNILDELTMALNRLQTTLLEEKETVADSRKRNTILTLVAWLKRVLQTSNSDNAAAQMFSLTDLLPTELLLTKLMPQLNNGNDNDNDEPAQNDRSPSSKRFSRQKNNRFNTIGVSKEELADARLYLQKKLLSENLATTATKVTTETEQQTIFDESEDSRRKSLNLTFSNDLDKDIRSIFRESKNSFSKSIDIPVTPEDLNPKLAFPVPGNDTISAFPAKTAFRRKSNPSNIAHNQSKDEPTDSEDENPTNEQRQSSNTPTANKPMNKFALRKMKMKRANTIDIPKEQLDDLNSDQGFSDGNKNSFRHDITVNDIRDNIKANVNADVDKNHLPGFQVKSSSDKKFMAFLNKNADENHSSWVNPHKTTLPVQQKTKQNNWSNKFGSIKNSFEQHENAPVSPRLTKKNNFTHAPTSPFKPVQTNKPPQVPNGVHHYQYNAHNVQHRVAALQAHDKVQPPPNPNLKSQLRTHQSVPSYPSDDAPQMYRDPNVQVKPNDWQQNKVGSVDSYMQNSVSPNVQPLPQSAYNPLYVPLNKQPSQSPANPLYTSPHSNQITPKSLVTTPNEFPNYTFTSTDYTQPSCVSTFGPESMKLMTPTDVPSPPVAKNLSPVIKNTILPDTSYLKSTSPPRTMPKPLLGSSRLSKQMKTVDVYSSNEYLSEPNNYYRSPQPFSPTYDYNYAPSHTSVDSRRSSGEFMATSAKIMQYPQCQTATVVNKITNRYDDEQQASNLRTFLTNRKEKRQSEYSEKSISPVSEPNFSQVNQTYEPPVEPKRQIPNSFVSMENVSAAHISTPEQGAPIRLRNNTAYYGSHNVLVSNDYPARSDLSKSFVPQQPPLNMFDSGINHNKYEFKPEQSIQHRFESKLFDKSQIAAPVRLNSYGSQYIQPKVESDLDFSKPTYGRKPVHGNINQNNVIRNNVTNLNRSNTTIHPRVGNYEIKRKQSLPAQNTDFFDYEPNNQNDESTHGNSYLPFGALKKSKSTHTLALLQQFEKGQTEETPLPSYIRRPIYNQPEPKPMTEIIPKSIIKKTPKVEDVRPVQPLSRPIQAVQAQAPVQQQPRPLQQSSQQPALQQSVPTRPKSPPQPAFIRPKSPPQMVPVRPKTPPQKVPVRPKTPPQSTPIHTKISAQKLEPPEIKETPSSPLVEDGHIIFPGQTVETKRRVQHYAKTLNAMLNRKSIVVDDDDEEDVSEKIDAKPLQRSKSGTLLSVPKQYESAIKKSEVLKKEQTVAAYFSGNKSPQGLQRSSSQHSMQSSTSVRTIEKQKSNTVSPLGSRESEMRESSSRTTTSTKSAHHLKILRKKQTSPNPLAKSQTLPSLLDESNVDDAFDDLFASFAYNK